MEFERIKAIAKYTGIKPEELGYIHSQIHHQGQAYYLDIMQLHNYGIPVIRILSEILKVNTVVVRCLIHEGHVKPEDIDDVFIKLTDKDGLFRM